MARKVSGSRKRPTSTAGVGVMKGSPMSGHMSKAGIMSKKGVAASKKMMKSGGSKKGGSY